VKRVAVIGSGGAGKSTFARQLGDRTGLPVIHLDGLFWGPDWAPMPKPDWIELERNLIAEDRWIMDGNYGSTQTLRLPRADTVIFLDIPRLVCLWSVTRRWALHRKQARPDMPQNADKLDLEFLRWIWTYPKLKRPEVLARLAALPSTTRIVRLRSRRAMREFLAGIPSAATEAAAA
jgi:adenylate kinase family enzyme